MVIFWVGGATWFSYWAPMQGEVTKRVFKIQNSPKDVCVPANIKTDQVAMVFLVPIVIKGISINCF